MRHYIHAVLLYSMSRCGMGNVRLYQTSDGWEGVVEETIGNQSYRIKIKHIKSEKIVVPDSADHIISNGGF